MSEQPGSSEHSQDSVERAAREAGEFAAGVAGVDPEQAAPIPADDDAALRDPEASSSEPAGD